MPYEIRKVGKSSKPWCVYNIPKNKLSKWLYVSLIFFYESKYFEDFARQNLKELLKRYNLEVVKETYGLINFIKILVCEKIL